ncbi:MULTISPECIES: TetR/AcrR family transcriptional regulator [Lactobacillus]|uniref:TetR/AcrR family transcriptional regulator n=1 Tax=Lactobacillus TaxID=1578 RepID=UPI00191C2FEC|nr:MULTISPECIES: TetR/AcrR family transcriptional regulator [Lactobacillus]
MSNRMTKQHQKNIINSFFDLLSKKKISEIHIIDIANNAHLSRRTFYRIFKNKDDIMDTYLQNLLLDYATWIRELSPKTYDQVIEDFFIYWPPRSEKLQILVKAGLGYKLLDNANQIFPDIFKEFHLTNKNVEWHMDVNNEIKVTYLARISVGIFWNTFTLWLENPEGISIEDLTQLIKHDIKQLGNY